MNSKTLSVVGFFVVVILLVGSGSAGFIAGWAFAPKSSGETAVSAVDVSDETATIREELFKPFWEAWQIVHDQYLVQPVDDEILMQGAIRGMMEALGDQHSSYMDPNEYRDATSNLSGEYEGIGAWVNTEGEYLTIAEPMKGSPAEEAGLKPGDEIVAIDGEDMTGTLPELARLKVLGPAGSTVILTIRRADVEELFDVTVERAAIVVPSVESEILEGKIAYVRMRNFGDNTSDELKSALETLLAQDPIGLIFDLRNNPGGGLVTSVEVASQFISSGVILYEENGEGEREPYNAIKGGLATDIPLVVLVNEFSASAAELVAGAIQDYGRAPLVGVTTFGKGTVQRWLSLSNEEGAVRVTIARWLTPEGRNIHEHGLTPDYEVDLTVEDFDAGRDPQLDKAIEILQQE